MCLTDFGMGGVDRNIEISTIFALETRGGSRLRKVKKRLLQSFWKRPYLAVYPAVYTNNRLYGKVIIFLPSPALFRAFFPPPGSTFQQPCDDFVRGIHRTVIQFVQIDLGRSFGRVPQTDADDRDRDTLFAGKARPAMPRNVEREFDRKIQAFAHIPEKAQVVGQAVFITQIEFLVEQPAFVRRRSIIHERAQ